MAYNKVSSFQTQIEAGSNNTKGCVTYRGTKIVEWNDHSITLKTGGWYSTTTKKKMNQVSHQFDLGFGVHQIDGDWYVSRWNDETKVWAHKHPYGSSCENPWNHLIAR